MENDKISETEEALTELYEANSPRDNQMVTQAIDVGDRADVLAAITAVNQSEHDFMEGVAALNAAPEETQGLVVRMQQEADAMRAALEQRLQGAVSHEMQMNVWPAKEGMTYSGPIVERDEVYQYQQVAPKTLIAHAADKQLETQEEGIGWMRGIEQEQDQARGISR